MVLYTETGHGQNMPLPETRQMTMTDHPQVIRARALATSGKLAEASRLCKQYLQQAPGDIAAVRLYGEIALSMSLNEQAVIIFQKLLALAPRDSLAHADLARAHFILQDYEKANHHAGRALRLNPKLTDSILLQAEIALAQGREDDADRHFRHLEQLKFDRNRIRRARLEWLLSVGRFDQAAQLLRALIRDLPDSADNYRQLALCTRLSEDHPDAALIRSLLADDGQLREGIRGDDREESAAHRALYKLESDCGHYDAAFRHLDQSKRAYLRANPATATSDREYNDDVHLHFFTREFIDNRSAIACQADDPIFVVGLPRSGTTLLERILATNSDIAAAGELNAISRIRQEICARFGSNQYDTRALAKVPPALWPQLGEEYLKRARQRIAGQRYFVDKMPDNYGHLGFIRAILPRARIIHLSRHPVATCFSIYEQDFGHRHNYALDLQRLGEHYLWYRKLMAYWRELFGEQIIELEYERMVQDTEGTATWLSEQLGVPLRMEQLDSAQNQGAIHTASIWQARQPVHSKSVDRWQNFRRHLGPLLETLSPVLDRSPDLPR